MKWFHILPPALAMVLAGGWIGIQHSRVSSMEEKVVLLRQIVAQARDKSILQPDDKALTRGSAADVEEEIDWQQLAEQMSGLQHGQMGSMRAMMKLQKQLLEMPEEKIIESIDGLSSLELTEEQRQTLEGLLIGTLVERNPALVIARYADDIGKKNGTMQWHLSSALRKWADKDPAAAIHWMDSQTAAGTFDSKTLNGKSESRLRFESSLISSLLKTDPSAADQRIAILPMDQRKELLQQIQVGQDDAKTYAGLVRGAFDEEKDVTEALAHASAQMAHRSYDAVTKFLDSAGLSEAERSAAVEKAAETRLQNLSWQKKIRQEDLEEMRTWAESQSPGSQDKLTGKAIATASQNTNNMSFSDASALALEYHEKSGNDEVLSAFLDGWTARSNKEQSRLLAEKISDPARRDEILKKLD